MILNPQHMVEQGVLSGENFQVQQNGIDLTIDKAFLITGGGASGIDSKENPTIEPEDHNTEGFFEFKKGNCYSIETEQFVDIPAHTAAFILQRSTLNRAGCFSQAGVYDSGFKNYVGFTLYCFNDISIQKHSRVAQIVFMRADSASLYKGQYQGK